jgi:hypothetical protein
VTLLVLVDAFGALGAQVNRRAPVVPFAWGNDVCPEAHDDYAVSS